MNKRRMINIILLLSTAAIAVAPLLIVKDSEFAGSDAAATEIVEEMNEGFLPWFKPLLEPPGKEMEGLLFALQAALGSGVIFYCIGYWKGKKEGSLRQ